MALTELKACGFSQIKIVNYGFPITELTRRFSNFLVRNNNEYESINAEQRSIRSAQTKTKIIMQWLRIFSGRLVSPFCIIQRWFYRFDWGDGYVVTALKATSSTAISMNKAGTTD